MGWYLRKSVKIGPMRVNFSKRGVGASVGMKGFRIGSGPKGPYVAGGRGGLYFHQNLRSRAARPASAQTPSAAFPPRQTMAQQPYSSQPPIPTPSQPSAYGPPPAPRAYHKYRGATLAIVSAAHALGWALMFADSSTQSAAQAASGTTTFGVAGNLGMLVWLGSMVAIAVVDWSGFISLRGRIPWWRLSPGAKIWLVCAYIFAFEIMAPIYLVGAWIDFRRTRAAEEQQRPFQIAQMESELGMTPATDGSCANCGKPLQAGAQFCAYCRTPIAPRPKVCPSCASLALPDAAWCPKCGASLAEEA